MPLATEAIAPYVEQAPPTDVEPGTQLKRVNSIATTGDRIKGQPRGEPNFASLLVCDTSSGTGVSEFTFVLSPSQGSNGVRKEESIAERIERHLSEDIETAELDDDEPRPTQVAMKASLTLGRQLEPFLTLTPNLKCAAFTRDDGSVEFVLHSLISKRRAALHVASDAGSVGAMMIDEQLRHTQRTISVDDLSTLREIAEWLKG